MIKNSFLTYFLDKNIEYLYIFQKFSFYLLYFQLKIGLGIQVGPPNLNQEKKKPNERSNF